eukprot:GHRR01007591.1.p1 GENE.GHRR01007591.1~~GHRR01007591.1.p1  ORF type:complete len:426 (+),score=114.61 GHRR01007591.1:462-1739(+)
MAVEVAGGYFAKSVAIMSDAAHMLSDVSAFLVSIFATWAATQPSSWHYSFGYHRAEILGALVSVLTIWAVTGALVYEACQRVVTPVRVEGKLMFIIASAGVVFNIIIALTLGVHGHLGHPAGSCGGHDHDDAGNSHSHEAGNSCSSYKHGHKNPQPGTSNHEHHRHASGDQLHHEHADHDHSSGRHSHSEGSHSVVINVANGAQGQQAERPGSSCTIRRTGSREIEVRCELPVSAVSNSSNSTCGNHGHTGHQHSHASHVHSGSGHGHSHDDAGSLNLHSAVLHVIGDLLQSVGVAIAGGLIWLNQDDPRWALADPICTFVFSVVVLLTTKSVLRDIIHVLMERTPQNISIPAVTQVMMDIQDVQDVHDLHIWNISTSQKPVLTAHVHIGPEADANVVLQRLEEYVRGLGIDHSTIQICNIQSQP